MRPLVMIGNPNTVFIRRMARYWSSRGVSVVIATSNHWNGGRTNEDGVPVIAAERSITPQTRAMLDVMLPVLGDLERELHDARPERVARALRSWGAGAAPPSLLPPLVDGVAIAEAVDRLDPAAVFGNEAFAYGLATALCRQVRKTMFAWGGDVLQFCNTSDAAERLMRSVLQRMHHIVVGSEPVRRRVVQQFGIAESRAVLIALGIDRAMFRRADASRRAAILTRYGIPPHASIVLNARRLRPHWGSEIALDAIFNLAHRRPNSWFVCLGGAGTEPAAAAARQRAAMTGLGSRFIALEGDASEEEVADLMAVADVFLSLEQDEAPLSLSVLQGVAAGGVPVIGTQQTYRDACEAGLRAALVAGDSSEAVAQAVEALLDDPDRRSDMATGNLAYIAREHDRETHMSRLLRIILGADAAAVA